MRKHLTYANVVATLCLVLVVGGGVAYAANTVGSADVIDNSLASVDLKNNDVRNVDVRDESLTGADVADNSIASADIAANSVAGNDIKNDNVTGTDINESTLVLDDHFSATAASGSCNDDNHTGVSCASSSFELERPGRVLMNATGNWHTAALNDGTGPGSDADNPIAVNGACSLRIDGSSFSSSTRMGESSPDGPVHPSLSDGTLALTDLTDRMFAGTHTVDLFCSELDGDLDWTNLRLTAARVDGGTPTKR